nr:F-box/kelch-repeat protein At3g23880-like [Ipomoea batatas]
MEASTPFSNIPNEIIPNILLQLPMKAVIRFQCVCKQWRSWIDGSDFKLSYRGHRRVIILSRESWNDFRDFVGSTSHDLRLQRHKSPLREAFPWTCGRVMDRVRVLCSCNGVVLLVVNRDILLWNPSTRCSTKVLEWPDRPIRNMHNLAGLCYDSCTRDYTAVLLFRYLGYYSGDPIVASASLNHKEWRQVQFPFHYNSAIGSVEFRNTFHWWVSDIKYWDLDWNRDMNYLSGGDRNMILYFDPVHDEFRILPTPKLRENDTSIVGLGVIDDCLSMACIVHKEERSEIKTMQVLIMKEYGRQESWITAFVIQMPGLGYIYGSHCLTFYSQKNNAQEILFLSRSVDWYGRRIYVYDQKTNKLKRDLMYLPTYRRYFGSMCFYVESFACPDRPQ